MEDYILTKTRPSITVDNSARRPSRSSVIPAAASSGSPQADTCASEGHTTSDVKLKPESIIKEYAKRWTHMKVKRIKKTGATTRIDYSDGILTIIPDPDDPAWRIFTFTGKIDGAPLFAAIPCIQKVPISRLIKRTSCVQTQERLNVTAGQKRPIHCTNANVAFWSGDPSV